MEKNIKPKISIAIPFYRGMKDADFFLNRCVDSIKMQTFTDYEIVITEDGSMPKNTNSAISKSKGELIKVLYMDDYFAHKDALKNIVESFTGDWMITGADNNPHPYWTEDIVYGNNKLGSPSALTIRNDKPLMFDEELHWLLDCDYYKRLSMKYGKPQILDEVNIIIGSGEHQATNTMGEDAKIKDLNKIKSKWGHQNVI